VVSLIIDIHTHIGEYEKHWSETLARTVSRGHGKPEDFKEMWDIDLDAYIADMDDAGIDVSVVMGMDFTRVDPTRTPADYIYKFLQRDDRLMGFIGLQTIDTRDRFNAPALKEFEEAVTEKGFVGLKLHPNYSHYRPNDKTAYPFYQKAVELGVPVLMHMGTTPATFAEYDAGHPRYVDDIAQDFPDLKICVAHMAYPWAEETLGLMRKCPNVYTDFSAACIRPIVLTWNLVLAKEYQMMDRTMFGSDYPCCTPRKDFIEWIKTDLNKQCEKSGWPTFTKGEIDNILGNTAKDYLGL